MSNTMGRAFGCGLLLASWITTTEASGADANSVLARVGERVQEYFQRAQSIVATETVRLKPFDTFATERRLIYDLRMAWEAAVSPGEAPKANIVRQLLKVNGRTPRPNDPKGCLDLQPVSPEPLSMLLPERRHENVYTSAGTGRVDGRTAHVINYKSVTRGPAEVEWHDDCVSVSLPGRTQGRVWIDTETNDVLRLDEELNGRFEVDVPPDKVRSGVRTFVLERADSTIRYKRVVFHDPDETLILPSSIESLTIFRGTGIPTLRTVQTFSDYKRFIGDSRLVTDPR